MNRTATIGSFMVVVAIAALAIWFTAKRGGQVDTPVPKEILGPNSQRGVGADPASNDPSVSLDAKFRQAFKVRLAHFGGDEFSPCDVDPRDDILYRWEGVSLKREQLRGTPYAGAISGIRVLSAKDFLVKTVQAPVKYLEANGEYRPGYLDTTIEEFYEWKSVTLSKKEILDKSRDGQDSIVKPRRLNDPPPQVIEIEMPAFLKDKPELWKKV